MYTRSVWHTQSLYNVVVTCAVLVNGLNAIYEIDVGLVNGLNAIYEIDVGLVNGLNAIYEPCVFFVVVCMYLSSLVFVCSSPVFDCTVCGVGCVLCVVVRSCAWFVCACRIVHV